MAVGNAHASAISRRVSYHLHKPGTSPQFLGHRLVANTMFSWWNLSIPNSLSLMPSPRASDCLQWPQPWGYWSLVSLPPILFPLPIFLLSQKTVILINFLEIIRNHFIHHRKNQPGPRFQTLSRIAVTDTEKGKETHLYPAYWISLIEQSLMLTSLFNLFTSTPPVSPRYFFMILWQGLFWFHSISVPRFLCVINKLIDK